MARNVVSTGIDYIPVPGEPYYPQGKPDTEGRGELVTVLKEDGANALIKDSNGDTRIVPKGWLQRG